MSSNCLASQTIDLTFLLSNKYLTPYAILDVPFVDIVADCKSMVVLYVLPDPIIELLTSNEPDIVTFWFNGLTKDAVDANEALTVLVAQLAVPIKAPVSEPVNEAVTEFKTASDPDTTTFFQFGIVILYSCG